MNQHEILVLVMNMYEAGTTLLGDMINEGKCTVSMGWKG